MSTRKKVAVQTLKCGLLLQNVRKSVEQYLRFYTDINKDVDVAGTASTDTYELVADSCTEILLHGLTTQQVESNALEVNTELLPIVDVVPASALNKLIEDFVWLQRSAQIGESHASSTLSNVVGATPTQFLHAWSLRNLQTNCLCACLQALVTDKELLECYYKRGAFLRQDQYATAFFICLSALELRQCSLLTQIEPNLCSGMTKTVALSAYGGALHKRANSQPNFLVHRDGSSMLNVTCTDGKVPLKKQTSCQPTVSQSILPILRKCKSLPVLSDVEATTHNANANTHTRPRSKTVGMMRRHQRQSTTTAIPIQKPNWSKSIFMRQRGKGIAHSNTTSSSSYSGGEDEQPSTSTASSRRLKLKNQVANSPSNSTATTSTSETSASVSSLNSTNTTRHIELIKCDDIKIWTDQTWALKQQKQQQRQEQEQNSNACNIPQQTQIVKQSKSFSPMNNFLCQLFGTSPNYASWSNSSLMQSSDELDPLIDAVPIYPCNASQSEVANSSGMFDGFLPIYGKKLRSRKSQLLFDESGISTLDYTATVGSDSNASTVEANETNATTRTPTPHLSHKDCQSLTSFLQMAQLSTRCNNTELEKENAHFRISEAIISALEHIKWTKQAPANATTTTTATDWLEKDRSSQSKSDTINEAALEPNSLTLSETNEHVPYAELEECACDELSAEVVGLSLIAKFNDKHLPKVSELKWLVSEEDAPQQLLPLPDTNATSNPDENLLPSITRGTRYWAPPRQQIIFTDHTAPNRKELIRKQNNRCAGCGMRVSPQYIQSFRYCTYLGKYHCTGCHRNQMSVIPAKILRNWDFKLYPVSVFAYRLLEQMSSYPLFYVPDLNPALYVQNSALLLARTKRCKLKFVKDFIKSCRFAVREQRYFDAVPTHITEDADIWSLADFIDAREKSMKRSIDELIHRCENHIFNCVLCAARGFICEQCNKDQIIYPWQNKVFRCDHCGACFHQKCWKSMLQTCCRCQRMHKRSNEIDDIDDVAT